MNGWARLKRAGDTETLERHSGFERRRFRGQFRSSMGITPHWARSAVPTLWFQCQVFGQLVLWQAQ